MPTWVKLRFFHKEQDGHGIFDHCGKLCVSCTNTEAETKLLVANYDPYRPIVDEHLHHLTIKGPAHALSKFAIRSSNTSITILPHTGKVAALTEERNAVSDN